MYDEYGNVITKLIQKRCMYCIPNYGQISQVFNEEAFYEYELVNEQGVDFVKIVLNVEQAERLAKYNGLVVSKHRD